MTSKLFTGVCVFVTVINAGWNAANANSLPTPTPAPIHHHINTNTAKETLADQSAKPDSPSLRISSSAIEQIDDRFTIFNRTAKAGVESGKETQQAVQPSVNEWFHNPTFYTEYDYINSVDKRVGGSDSNTSSAVVGFDFMTKYDILTGVIYTYSFRNAAISPIGLADDQESHFISLYVAKSFWQWLNVGVTNGYGYTSLSQLGGKFGNEDTWDVSPFVGVSHSWGAFSASLTTAYLQTWSNAYGLATPSPDADTEVGETTVTLRLGYAVTEKLNLQVIAKYTGLTNTDAAALLPEARNWATFGAKATYRLIENLDAYAGYSYDAFNSSYRDNNIQAGLSYSW